MAELQITDIGGDDLVVDKRSQEIVEDKPDAFMLCFAINSRASFDSLKTWRSILNGISDTAPIILIATKCDLWKSGEARSMDLVSAAEIEAKRSELQLQALHFTSAKDSWLDGNVHLAFMKAAKVAYEVSAL